MKLSIVVPHYKEPWETCEYLFNSIAMQRNVPWEEMEVIVVNDGDDTTIDNVDWGKYPFSVRYMKKPHGGISAARNYGIDHSEAEYLMFCDIDDGFLNNYGLHMLFAAIAEGFDYLIGTFVEESLMPDNKTIALVRHDNDMTFMHGKAYKRDFLLDNNVRFDEAMTLHEDGYFNMLAYAVAKQTEAKIKRVETPFYIWCWNWQSTVRKDKEDFVLKTYPSLMQTRIGICNQFKERGYNEAFASAVCMTVLNSYYDFQKPRWRIAKNERYFRIAEREFKKYWMLFQKDFKDLTNETIAEVAKAARETACNNGMLMEQEDLKTFLKHIDSIT